MDITRFKLSHSDPPFHSQDITIGFPACLAAADMLVNAMSHASLVKKFTWSEALNVRIIKIYFILFYLVVWVGFHIPQHTYPQT